MQPDTTPAPIGADAALARLVAAVEAETAPDWVCNSYHPSLWPALKAARAALASAAQPAVPDAHVAAWMTPDGDRVVTEVTMAGARKDGGATLSSLRPYSIPLVRASAAQPASAHQQALESVALLADILNRRPAMNAGLAEAYAHWTAEVYELMGAIAAEPAYDAAAPKAAPAAQGDALTSALETALDAALDFAGTVAGGASWWDDVWANHEAAIDAARAAKEGGAA